MNHMRNIPIIGLLALMACAQPKPPRTKPLPSESAKDLTINYQAFRLASLERDRAAAEMEKLKAKNDADIARICKAAGFERCQINPETMVIAEVLDKPEAKK
jgi:hypothetical protein